jgi:hypothetical protein
MIIWINIILHPAANPQIPAAPHAKVTNPLSGYREVHTDRPLESHKKPLTLLRHVRVYNIGTVDD